MSEYGSGWREARHVQLSLFFQRRRSTPTRGSVRTALRRLAFVVTVTITTALFLALLFLPVVFLLCFLRALGRLARFLVCHPARLLLRRRRRFERASSAVSVRLALALTTTVLRTAAPALTHRLATGTVAFRTAAPRSRALTLALATGARTRTPAPTAAAASAPAMVATTSRRTATHASAGPTLPTALRRRPRATRATSVMSVIV